MRALTTSAGVPIIAPTNLKTFLIGLVMDQVSAWATFREEKNCALDFMIIFLKNHNFTISIKNSDLLF